MIERFKIVNLKFKINRGFTIVEMLIYMGLLSIFLVVLTEIFTSILNIFAESETTSAIEQDTRFISSRLVYDINRASTITTPTLGSSTSSLTIQINSQDFTYGLTGDNFVLTNNALTNAINSSQTKISNLTFLRIGKSGGKNSLKIQFTITSTRQESQGPRSKTYQTTIGIR